MHTRFYQHLSLLGVLNTGPWSSCRLSSHGVEELRLQSPRAVDVEDADRIAKLDPWLGMIDLIQANDGSVPQKGLLLQPRCPLNQLTRPFEGRSPRHHAFFTARTNDYCFLHTRLPRWVSFLSSGQERPGVHSYGRNGRYGEPVRALTSTARAWTDTLVCVPSAAKVAYISKYWRGHTVSQKCKGQSPWYSERWQDTL